MDKCPAATMLLDPEKVLSRGYSIVQDSQERVVSDAGYWRLMHDVMPFAHKLGSITSERARQ